MSAVVTAPTSDAVVTTLCGWLASLFGVPVVKGLGNRVPMPFPLPGYIVVTELFQTRLSTTIDNYSDPFPAVPSVLNAEMDTELTVQVDFYGPASSAWAIGFCTLFRDSAGCDALAQTCQPLYADEARLIPLIDGEDQYERRYTVSAALQYNPVTTIPQQFAGVVGPINLIDVDEKYPPAPGWLASSSTVKASSTTALASGAGGP